MATPDDRKGLLRVVRRGRGVGVRAARLVTRRFAWCGCVHYASAVQLLAHYRFTSAAVWLCIVHFAGSGLACIRQVATRGHLHASEYSDSRNALARFVEDVQRFLASRAESEWCLKFPTACGASGHRMLADEKPPPAWWPMPFVVQEFVRLEQPEVFRTYAAGGETFGWMARRFPAGAKSSPWVAHARGARYEHAGTPPEGATAVARAALASTGLLDSFGCVDLLQKPTGEWVALEVGTDGLVNHVDCDLGNSEMEAELSRRIAATFWRWVGVAPP
jgi:hypothetical protein